MLVNHVCCIYLPGVSVQGKRPPTFRLFLDCSGNKKLVPGVSAKFNSSKTGNVQLAISDSTPDQ